MDSTALRLYLQEIETQRAYAELAVELLNIQLLKEDRDIKRLFFAIQALLSPAATISKIIWGPATPRDIRPWKDDRLTELQRVLDAHKDLYPQLNNRAVRNSLEHIDDRIDAWCVNNNARRVLIQNLVGSRQYIGIEDAAPEMIFRQFDPETKTCGFFDWSIDVQELCTEIAKVADKARERREGISPF